MSVRAARFTPQQKLS